MTLRINGLEVQLRVDAPGVPDYGAAMDQFLMNAAALGLLGMFVGFLSGLLGIGGGIVLVPSLIYLGHTIYDGVIPEEMLAHIALGTSLAIIIPTTASSARSQIKKQMVEWGVIRTLTPGLLIGVTLGVLMAAKTEGAVLQTIFAFGLLLIAALIAYKPQPHHIHPVLLNWKFAVPATSAVGFLATMMGIGGAILNIPYMTFGGVPLHRAIATGSVLGMIVALPAAIGFMLTGMAGPELPPEFLGYINMKAWILIVPFSILMAPLGVKASHKMDVKKLRVVFAGFILIVAAKMLWNVFIA